MIIASDTLLHYIRHKAIHILSQCVKRSRRYKKYYYQDSDPSLSRNVQFKQAIQQRGRLAHRTPRSPDNCIRNAPAAEQKKSQINYHPGSIEEQSKITHFLQKLCPHMLTVISSHRSVRQTRQCRGFKLSLGGSAPSKPTSVSERLTVTSPCADATVVTVLGDTTIIPAASERSIERESGPVAPPSLSVVIGTSNAAASSAVGSSCGSDVGVGDARSASIAIAGSGSGS